MNSLEFFHTLRFQLMEFHFKLLIGREREKKIKKMSFKSNRNTVNWKIDFIHILACNFPLISIIQPMESNRMQNQISIFFIAAASQTKKNTNSLSKVIMTHWPNSMALICTRTMHDGFFFSFPMKSQNVCNQVNNGVSLNNQVGLVCAVRVSANEQALVRTFIWNSIAQLLWCDNVYQRRT